MSVRHFGIRRKSYYKTTFWIRSLVQLLEWSFYNSPLEYSILIGQRLLIHFPTAALSLVPAERVSINVLMHYGYC